MGANMKITACILALVAAEKMTTEVAESSNMHFITNRAARNNACVAAGKCLNPYCSLYDCYEKNNKPLCAGETKNVLNTPAEAKVGVHHNIKETVVSGWKVLLNENYGAQHNRQMTQIITDWNTANNWMFVAAQYTQDRGNDFYIGAFAPTQRVFSRCNNSRHCGYRTLPAADCIHGSFWYCVTNWSFGFTAQNQVRLCSADTFGVWGGAAAEHGNHRLSWHMHYSYTAGWRAGWAHSMNSERGVFKLVYTKQCNGCGKAPVVACKTTTCTYSAGVTSVFSKKVVSGSTEKWDCKKTGAGCTCNCATEHKCALTHGGVKNTHC